MHLYYFCSHTTSKMAKQMFFQSHIQTSLPGGSIVCQVPAQCKFLWLNSQPLTIGGYNEMLTDPLAPTNVMAQCKGGCVPGEVLLGPCKPINPYKKKSGFSLTAQIHGDFWARHAGLYFGLYRRDRDVQRNSQLPVCVISFPKWCTLVFPKMAYSTSLQHPGAHSFQNRTVTKQIQSLEQTP